MQKSIIGLNNTTPKPLNQNKMKAKLIKIDDVYRLVEVTKHGNSIIGTTDLDYQKSWSDRCQKLSLKNCQAIERGYDLDEMAEEEFPIKIQSYYEGNEDVNRFERFSFIKGFQKALELMGDKKFSEEDMRMAFFHVQNEPTFDEFIQSLQPVEWEVEVVEFTADDLKSIDKEWHKLGEPKLDADGCLILKRI